MHNLIDEFGCNVFDEKKMKKFLPSNIYEKWISIINKKTSLDQLSADIIAYSMKEWALSLGCNHYAHWFQPLNGKTAKKHNAFIDKNNKETITNFSGKSLIKGEVDASSFPSGGLRNTFQARGYTYWDVTSPVFIKDNILFIPSIFLSYKQETLDIKTPLLKSIDLISSSCMNLLKLFGEKNITNIFPLVGLEQEYFLIDKSLFIKRKDLLLCGKTLFGTLPPKAQELENHYLGAIPKRVHKFMIDVNKQLWHLGIYAKSEHNEVAPNQFELAQLHERCNIAIDQNQLIMEILQETALKHNLVCLLNEKPFKGVNGSGKHNNYSLVTNKGINLFEISKNKQKNIQFLLFICAFIKAIDENDDLIRLFSSCQGNDSRLGGNEAPPAIISIYLGEPIEALFNQLINKKIENKEDLYNYVLSSLSNIPFINSDRNRTSPIAFTGNKFEIRTLGSSQSAGYLNIVLNTIISDSLNQIIEQLKDCKNKKELKQKSLEICISIIKNHQRIIFNGNGYSQEWINEASKRNLNNFKSIINSLKYVEENNKANILIINNILKKEELNSRFNIMYENYYKKELIEIKTMIDLLKNTIYPLINKNIILYSLDKEYMPKYIQETKIKFKNFIDSTYLNIKELEKILDEITSYSNYKEKSLALLDKAKPIKDIIRDKYDEIEQLIDINTLSYPKYIDIFFSLDFHN